MSLLSDIGEALYGPRWQSELARALGVSIRTAQRWAQGAHEPPRGVYAELAAIAAARSKDLGVLQPLLARAAKE